MISQAPSREDYRRYVLRESDSSHEKGSEEGRVETASARLPAATVLELNPEGGAKLFTDDEIQEILTNVF